MHNIFFMSEGLLMALRQIFANMGECLPAFLFQFLHDS
jgi:hypothetical protein